MLKVFCLILVLHQCTSQNYFGNYRDYGGVEGAGDQMNYGQSYNPNPYPPIYPQQANYNLDYTGMNSARHLPIGNANIDILPPLQTTNSRLKPPNQRRYPPSVENVARKRTTILESSIGTWGEWMPWSMCSQSCGEGVNMRSRQCHRGYSRFISNDCIGSEVQYSECMGESCPGVSDDLRNSQCSSHNYDLYEGFTTYKWEPFYRKEHAPCSVYCMASELDFYEDFGMALDGTPCGPNQEGMCISGACRPVGCDGIVESLLQFDLCGICGGDNSTCYYMHEIFERFPPGHAAKDFDYNEIAKIPAGATKIMIHEFSKNYLVLAEADEEYFSYVINGNWVVSWPGSFSAGGSIATYSRDGDKEFLTIPGPTYQDLHIMILYLGSVPLLEYEYYRPMNEETDKTYGEFRQQNSKIEIPQEFDYNYPIELRQVDKYDESGRKILPTTSTTTTIRSTTSTTTEKTTTTTTPPTTTTTPTKTTTTTTKLTTTTPRKIAAPRAVDCRNCRRPKGRKKHFCSSDFAIHGRVTYRKRFKHGKLIRYGVEVVTSYKSKMKLTKKEFIWVPNACCPRLRNNKHYVLMGKLIKVKVKANDGLIRYETRLQVDHRNYWSPWKSSYNNRLKKLANKQKCKKS